MCICVVVSKVTVPLGIQNALYDNSVRYGKCQYSRKIPRTCIEISELFGITMIKLLSDQVVVGDIHFHCLKVDVHSTCDNSGHSQCNRAGMVGHLPRNG